MYAQEFAVNGDEFQLANHWNTDDAERDNWRERQQSGKGFIREDGELKGRRVARIPLEEAAHLRAVYDIDFLSWEQCNDRAAFRRLLKRFPHWQVCDGGV